MNASPIQGFMLVRIRGTKILLVIDHQLYTHNGTFTTAQEVEHMKFVVEQHSCPVNFLGVKAVIDGDDQDPHGILELVNFAPVPSDFDDDDCNYDWSQLFSEIPK